MTPVHDRRVSPPPGLTIEPERVVMLLRPFLSAPLEAPQLTAISIYVSLLLRWNARLNLTTVREPDYIVTRHIGESLFCAAQLLQPHASPRVIDVGSGAGFPGLPLKIYAGHLRLTLIEAQQKKATFLKEVVRALHLQDVRVFADRAECFPEQGRLVTMRAVERFAQALPVAASLLERSTTSAPLLAPGTEPSRLAILISAAQIESARKILPAFKWFEPLPVPQSDKRILLVGEPR